MIHQQQSEHLDPLCDPRQARVFVPGRRFASAREFAEFLREAEVVQLYRVALWV